jgi:hypothetical protein
MWQATTHLLIHLLYVFVDTQLFEHLLIALQALLTFKLHEAHICQRGSRLQWWHITGRAGTALHVARGYHSGQDLAATVLQFQCCKRLE